MRDVGWVWEGQPAYRDFPPSMYGLGEGCKYFGLSKAYYLYHGNNQFGLSKLGDVKEVICDISIWKYRKIENAEKQIGWGIYHEKDPAVMIEEARKVSRLSKEFPNVIGAMKDDLLGAVADLVSPDSLRNAVKASVPEGTEELNLRAFEGGHGYHHDAERSGDRGRNLGDPVGA